MHAFRSLTGFQTSYCGTARSIVLLVVCEGPEEVERKRSKAAMESAGLEAGVYFIINAPRFLAVGWKVISPVLNKRTQEKISINAGYPHPPPSLREMPCRSAREPKSFGSESMLGTRRTVSLSWIETSAQKFSTLT